MRAVGERVTFATPPPVHVQVRKPRCDGHQLGELSIGVVEQRRLPVDRLPVGVQIRGAHFVQETIGRSGGVGERPTVELEADLQ
jgi:hypothetical protein